MVDLETWENPHDSLVAVIKVGRGGIERNEFVPPHQKFSITSEDRLLNQDRAASPEQDMFTNGMLIPKTLPARILSGDEEDIDVALNPNMMSDTDLKELFKLQWRVFPKKVAEITSPVTLARLLNIAEEIDATVKQVEVINNQMIAADPTQNRGENVELGKVKKIEGIVPRGLDGDDEDYVPSR